MNIRILLAAAVVAGVGCAPTAEEPALASEKPVLVSEKSMPVSDKWAAQAAPFSMKITAPTGSTGFYKPTKASASKAIDFKAIYGAAGDGVSDESSILQNALDGLSEQGGGRLYLPKGTYVFSGINMPSNTHIEIEAGSIIRPVKTAYKGNGKKKARKPTSIRIFNFGKMTVKTENVSITGRNGSFVVELSEYKPGVAVFAFGNAKNFRISGVEVKDALTKFSVITMGPSGSREDDRGIPTDGYISDITQSGSHYGYGVVQTQAARNVLFERLHGEGGAVLRMETGFKGMNDDQFGGVSNLIGKGISCKDGNAAVMISPHAMHNGVVAVDGVRSDGCGFAVRVGNGFIAKKYSNPNLEIGTFAKGTKVTNIFAKYGENAQLKSKHYKFMPEALLGKISKESEDGSSHRGPSVSAVLNTANYPVKITNVSSEGFEGTPDVATKPAARTKRKRSQ